MVGGEDPAGRQASGSLGGGGGSAVGFTTRQWVDPEYSTLPQGTGSLPPQGLGWCRVVQHLCQSGCSGLQGRRSSSEH